MKLTYLLISLCGILSVGCYDSGKILASRSSLSSDVDLSKGNWSVDEIVQIVDSVRPWSSEATYGPADWDRIIKIARIFQNLHEETITNALDRFSFQIKKNFQGDYLEDSKPFLLLRVMFELPENAPRSERTGGGWVTFNSDINSDGSVNQNWPISWKNGKPSMVSRYLGYQGIPYNPKLDYLKLNGRFKKRML